ncbi:MAG TPA: class I SAM-dependent methyltransferase [Solirubrobacteraceae bacterium]|nr:class I SAM-dependent methyltransferase [Solirubrobacteraceae bacterium]
MAQPRDLFARLTDPRQFDLVPTGPGAILDIGCGAAKTPGAVGLDISPDTAADIVHDLDRLPYPIADASFDQILLQDVIEHVSEPIRVFEELHRIGRPGARVQLRTPHFSSALAYGDPTHRHCFSTIAIRSLAEPRFAHYTAVRFRVVHVTLDMWLAYRALGLGLLFNRAQETYEKYFAFICPSMNIRAEFEVLKD